MLSPVAGLSRPSIRLFLVSCTLLFAELLLIRWIPAEVIYVGFFRNFLLMASFLGIGLGILLGTQREADRAAAFRAPAARRDDPGRDRSSEHPAHVPGRDLLRPQREQGSRRQLHRAAGDGGPGGTPDGRAGHPTGSAAHVDATAAGVRHRHRRFDGRDRRIHGTVRPGHPAARLVPRPWRPAGVSAAWVVGCRGTPRSQQPRSARRSWSWH